MGQRLPQLDCVWTESVLWASPVRDSRHLLCRLQSSAFENCQRGLLQLLMRACPFVGANRWAEVSAVAQREVITMTLGARINSCPTLREETFTCLWLSPSSVSGMASCLFLLEDRRSHRNRQSPSVRCQRVAFSAIPLLPPR